MITLTLPDTETISASNVIRVVSRPALFSLVATTVFILAIGALHLLTPQSNPLANGISFYALEPYGWLLNFALVILGAGGVGLAIAQMWETGSLAGRLGFYLLTLWALSTILAGMFPLDAPGAAPTISGRVHNLVGLNFLLLVPAVICETIDGSRVVRKTGPFFAVAILLASVLLFLFNGPLYSLALGGVAQRLYWLVAVAWLLSAAAARLRPRL